MSDLGPLSKLSALTKLYFSNSLVSDLEPLLKLSALTKLDCSGTSVKDLTPLAELTALVALDCSRTSVSDLSPLCGLRALAELHCSNTSVSDLRPLSGLRTLTELHFSSSTISDLSPLSKLSSLTTLYCANTPVEDLAPLSALSALAELVLTGSPVSDLAPLSALKALTKLDCGGTKITKLDALSGLDNLIWLGCSDTVTGTWPRRLLELPHFGRLIAADARIDQIPSEELSQYYGDNCLPNIRAYFADLDAGAAALERSKVIVLGNGQVGKTQLRRWLLNSDAMPLPYDPAIPSTHGIEVLRGPLALPSGDELDGSVWDFGGQDIYHDTHSLFMKTRAIFVLCWNPEQEDNREQLLDGLIHQNRPMAYWVDYVRKLAGSDNR